MIWGRSGFSRLEAGPGRFGHVITKVEGEVWSGPPGPHLAYSDGSGPGPPDKAIRRRRR